MNNASQVQTIPLSINIVEEQLQVKKNIIEKSKVRIEKKVREEEETIHIPVLSEEVRIEKIAVNKYIHEALAIRYEGDTMIIPVIKEVIIVEKRLLLVEEVRVTKLTHTTQEQQNIMLRKEEVTIERITPAE